MPVAPEAVLLDVDGTLVDSTYLHAVAWAEVLAQQGFSSTTERAHRCIGMDAARLITELTGTEDEDVHDALKAAHKTLYGTNFGHLRPLPGARELLHDLHGRGLTVVLASSASEEELGALRATLDADAWITRATSSADAEQGKPAPDILETALDGLAPDRAVFLGDAVWDAQACSRAGVPFYGLTCGGTDGVRLTEAGAVRVFADPSDVRVALDDLGW